ncbi:MULTISPECIES: hypothetical protein [unclassified Wenzhouxiangella]|uniref:hypothetical protein n=1 Tax=unclassified Wenzhouxiangella TaxID=2613841 RepID=UPI000E32769A|nr:MULTISPECIES: hypothetical protein [unclassified Wenzhouxiangella]RFF28115.1 hypothetical protein DZK25_04365 [Wenzhouxiangella sp. 15181]RFP68088.1 hypothetical protein DZK26_09810 [Wenzhouxiangella sp. 15190]
MKLMTDGRKLLLAGVALTACLGFALNAQAQTCTTGNWFDVEGSPAVGKQDGDNRRYGGPCGMRVQVDGTPRYVADDSPGDEATYILRFYVFLDEAATNDPIVLFAADNDSGDTVYDASDNQIEMIYDADDSSGGSIMLSVREQDGTTWQSTSVPDVGSGWHSIEVSWARDSSTDTILNVDGGSDVQLSADTTGIGIENAFLGVLNSVGSTGFIDFDDFDSRRQERPGRLCRGLTVPETERAALDLEDVNKIFDEFASGGSRPVGGQPDYNEDGAVDLDDVNTVFSRFAGGNEDCDLNR